MENDEQPRTAAEGETPGPRTAAEVASTIRAESDEKLARHTRHLCINGWKDVVWVVGSLGVGIGLARVSEETLTGRWRALPIVVGLVLSIAARRTDPRTTRFVHKAALAVGGIALVTGAIHFTMQARIESDRVLEA